MTNNLNTDTNPDNSLVPKAGASSKNALKHGLSSTEFCLLRDEDKNHFEEHRRSIETALAPKNVIEAIHVLRIVETTWLMFRASLVEAKCIDMHMDLEKDRLLGDDAQPGISLKELQSVGAEYVCYRALEDLEARSNTLSNINRYRTTHERSFFKNLNALQKLRGPNRPLLESLPAGYLGLLSGHRSTFDMKLPSRATPNPTSQTTESKREIEICETKSPEPLPTVSS